MVGASAMATAYFSKSDCGVVLRVSRIFGLTRTETCATLATNWCVSVAILKVAVKVERCSLAG